MSCVDGGRLQKLLGGIELANLRMRLRARYERDASQDAFTLTDLRFHERRALAGLLGRRALAACSMRIRRSALDAALAHAGIADTLREALEFLGNCSISWGIYAGAALVWRGVGRKGMRSV